MPDGTSDLVVTKRVQDQTLKCGDCLVVMKTDIPARSVDVVVTSPPYNLNLAYGVYDDFGEMKTDTSIGWREVTGAVKRVMKPDGSFFLNIAGSNSRPDLPFKLMVRLRALGFYLQNHITWMKSITMEKSYAAISNLSPADGSCTTTTSISSI